MVLSSFQVAHSNNSGLTVCISFPVFVFTSDFLVPKLTHVGLNKMGRHCSAITFVAKQL